MSVGKLNRPLAGPEVQALLRKLPRVAVASLPTPLDECPRLSRSLGGPRILIKRDDLTGLATGGNKARMLEFLMADAQQKGADVVITSAPTQSNFCRMVVAAGAKLGIKVILLLRTKSPQKVEANLLLDDLLGADIRMVVMENVNDKSQTDRMMEEIASELRRAGHNPYAVDLRTASMYAAVGYIDAVRELYGQLGARCVRADYVFVTTCAGGTQGGLVLGAKLMNLGFKVIGSRMRGKKEELYPLVHEAIEDASKLLQIEAPVDDEDIVVVDEYTGKGVGDVPENCREAIRLVAEKEGILLDPVYTGKTMAGIIDYVRKGKIGPDETVILWHTGGTPLLFLFGDGLASTEYMG